MKQLLSILCSLAVAAGAYGAGEDVVLDAPFTGNAQNRVLSQLGSRGATEIGGSTKYAHYLVRLNENGVLSTAMLPAGLGSDPLSRTVVLDPLMGEDTASANGSVGAPYKTLSYAMSNYTNATASGVVYYLTPGSYSGITIDTAGKPALTDLVFYALEPRRTSVAGIQYSSASPSAITCQLVGLTVTGEVKQNNNRALTLYLNNADVSTVTMTYTGATCTIYRDPASTVSSYPVNYTEVLLHESDSIAYTNSDYSYVNVKEALDALLYVAPVGTLSGGTSYDIGRTITNVDLTFTCNKTMTNRAITGGGTNVVLGAGGSGSYTLTNALASTNVTYTFTVTDGTATNASTTSLYFRNRKYYGFNDVTNSINNAQILALSESTLTTTRTISATDLTPSGTNYIWVCYPASFGAATFKLNGLTSTDWLAETNNFVNMYGYTNSYLRYRSPNQYSVTMTLEVN